MLRVTCQNKHPKTEMLIIVAHAKTDTCQDVDLDPHMPKIATPRLTHTVCQD